MCVLLLTCSQVTFSDHLLYSVYILRKKEILGSYFAVLFPFTVEHICHEFTQWSKEKSVDIYRSWFVKKKGHFSLAKAEEMHYLNLRIDTDKFTVTFTWKQEKWLDVQRQFIEALQLCRKFRLKVSSLANTCQVEFVLSLQPSESQPTVSP